MKMIPPSGAAPLAGYSELITRLNSALDEMSSVAYEISGDVAEDNLMKTIRFGSTGTQ